MYLTIITALLTLDDNLMITQGNAALPYLKLRPLSPELNEQKLIRLQKTRQK